MLQATRTLVKSAPELWAEVADPEALATHLGVFGAVSITDCEQERRVTWSAEHGVGTLELEPAGFGTRVRMRAEASVISETPAPEPEPVPEPRRGVWSRLTRRRPDRIVVPEPAEPIRVRALGDDEVLAVLQETLDSLGTAHHRPFSRS